MDVPSERERERDPLHFGEKTRYILGMCFPEGAVKAKKLIPRFCHSILLSALAGKRVVFSPSFYHAD